MLWMMDYEVFAKFRETAILQMNGKTKKRQNDKTLKREFVI